jgi:hypothetical protein
VTAGPLAAPVDAAQTKLIVQTETGKLPGALVELIRSAGVLDVEILAPGQGISASAISTLALLVRTAGSSSGDDAVYVRQAMNMDGGTGIVAAVQADSGPLRLRAVVCQGAAGVRNVPLEARRFACLLQACRPS